MGDNNDNAAEREFRIKTGRVPLGIPGQALLAIDTSLGTVVAVSNGDRAWEFASDDPLAHAEVIGDLIEKALEAAELTSADVTGVVMGTGPGSFTGLRIGMAAAHGFAAGQNIPLLPLLSHEASAAEYFWSVEAGKRTRVRIVQDARRRELFVTDYVKTAPTGESLGEKIGTAISALFGGFLEENPVTDEGPTCVDGPRVVAREGYEPSDNDHTPEAVSGIALLRLAASRLAWNTDFESPEPVYLRDPDVRAPQQPR